VRNGARQGRRTSPWTTTDAAGRQNGNTGNHPNIAAIYGIEQGVIVMELVEGDDLQGPVAIERVTAAHLNERARAAPVRRIVWCGSRDSGE